MIPWGAWTIAVVSAIVVNLPQVVLFIALALLAIRGQQEEMPITTEREMS